ncbi:cell division protein FtsQ/DivIB [Paenibacillus marinisediminis]
MQVRAIPPLPDKPSKKRKGTKLVWLLVFLFIVILGVLFFRSPISKITEVRFVNNTYADPGVLQTVSGVKKGEPFFRVTEAQAAERIKVQFPYIKDVTLEKHFPGRVDVQLQEYKVVAYELSADGQVMAILENGSDVVLSNSKKFVLEKPLLTNWNEPAAKHLKDELGKQLALIPDRLLADISEICYFPSSSYADRIKLYTRSGFEVVTTISFLPDKIAYLSGVVETQEPGQITMLEADSYISYTNLAKGENGDEGQEAQEEQESPDE